MQDQRLIKISATLKKENRKQNIHYLPQSTQALTAN